MKKFLIISRRLDNTISAPKCSYNLALALAELNVDVKILTSVISLPMEDLKRLRNAGVKIVRMPKIFADRFLSPIFYSISAKVKREDRIVIGNGYTFGDDITWVHFLRLGAIKYLSDFLDDKVKQNLRRESYIEKMIFRSSKKLWAVSNLVKKILVEEYNISEDKIYVLYNGVDIEKYHPLNDEDRQRIRKSLGISENTKVMIFVGGDPYRKGFQRILYALKKNEKMKNISNKNYILYAIGFNPHNEILNLSLDLNIKYLGKISEEDLIKYYQISDLLLLPSYYDPFPLVVLEAMACGAVPIVTPFTGASEIIDQGKNGFIVNDEKDLTEKILMLIKSDLEDLRKEAIITANKYSWLNIAKFLIKTSSLK
jgi:UDP-glucose:(heptosyl)LPS alpha-1,3-glucosyltransferase